MNDMILKSFQNKCVKIYVVHDSTGDKMETIKLLLKFTEETRLQQLMTHVSIKQCVSYCRRVEAMLAVMVCAGILGRPDD